VSFHLGKPILVMLVLSAVCGAAIALRPRDHRRTDLELWVFADSHARTYRPLESVFERKTGISYRVQSIAVRAENVRLMSKFMSGTSDVPDAVEIEIQSVGQYFRPPVQDIGFLPLNDYLRRSGWMDKLVRARLMTWSKDGVIFGVPHDVHPVTITFRDDLFQQAGVDLAASKTWPQFQDNCLKFQRYWQSRGLRRFGLELPPSLSDYLIIMLLQRHINPIDAAGNIYLTDPRVAQTLAFYAQCVAGPRAIGGWSGSNAAGVLATDLTRGNIGAYFTPDWRVRYVKDYAPTISGKVRMMALPVFDPGDAPTATWGGTMIGIPRMAKNPDASWKLIEFLYFSPQGIEARREYTKILPPIVSLWNDPIYQREDPYFGGQKVEQLFVRLAAQIPTRTISPATTMVLLSLSAMVNDARAYVEDHGTAGLEDFCRRELARAAADLQQRIDHTRFDEKTTEEPEPEESFR